MQVFVAGTGKLGSELLKSLTSKEGQAILPWHSDPTSNERSIVIHAGSGRELQTISTFCSRTSSVLIELSTGSAIESVDVCFPVVLCPNTNILMLKFMHMLECSGSLFSGYDIQLTESHQASKKSVPGTAVAIANALSLSIDKIASVRDTATQTGEFKIQEEHLGRHAFHQIRINDGSCQIAMESRVVGDSPYAHGVQQIVSAVIEQKLLNRIYSITEFIEKRWL
ncbi:dihydrodipicolinate reductase C-terminal domain-containing protein [Comamonas sp. AG1104]|uniref:dihydrodipicolinate reductase C-terminal domain-containing protein n=1 Tax=Comamonas sp. AG1104 TaxID=2183900 RepID=UPI000E0BE651|nr:dihydrodipicolinate reductase C-terminal domain-containing protein [Comamonas sp. AG1104]RDI10539.1 dihydrodipicolinate reductase [Comamonas sp. AG1104]